MVGMVTYDLIVTQPVNCFYDRAGLLYTSPSYDTIGIENGK